MKPKPKVVLTTVVAGAMTMGAVTGVIFPQSRAQALDLPGSINTSTRSSAQAANSGDATDPQAAARSESQADTDARMRDAESRMSGSRGSLQSDITAGSDPNAELRAQIRDTNTDAKAGISTEVHEDDDNGDNRSGGLNGMVRGQAGVNTGN